MRGWRFHPEILTLPQGVPSSRLTQPGESPAHVFKVFARGSIVFPEAADQVPEDAHRKVGLDDANGLYTQKGGAVPPHANVRGTGSPVRESRPRNCSRHLLHSSHARLPVPGRSRVTRVTNLADQKHRGCTGLYVVRHRTGAVFRAVAQPLWQLRHNLGEFQSLCEPDGAAFGILHRHHRGYRNRRSCLSLQLPRDPGGSRRALHPDLQCGNPDVRLYDGQRSAGPTRHCADEQRRRALGQHHGFGRHLADSLTHRKHYAGGPAGNRHGDRQSCRPAAGHLPARSPSPRPRRSTKASSSMWL